MAVFTLKIKNLQAHNVYINGRINRHIVTWKWRTNDGKYGMRGLTGHSGQQTLRQLFLWMEQNLLRTALLYDTPLGHNSNSIG